MQISTFKQRLNSTLKDNAINRYVSGQKKGKLDFNSVHKIALSSKIFKQKQERKGKDYSITLLLDASGSMDNDAELVGNIAQDFSDIFEKINIPNAVYIFNDYTYLIKDFDVINKQISSQYCNKVGSGTNDALGVHIVGNEISKRNKKNILIVVTDGEGNDYSNISEAGYAILQEVDMYDLKNVKTVVKGLHRKYKDLEIFCLCIGNATLEKYAKNIYGTARTKRVNNATEARQAIIQLLNKIIKKA